MSGEDKQIIPASGFKIPLQVHLGGIFSSLSSLIGKDLWQSTQFATRKPPWNSITFELPASCDVVCVVCLCCLFVLYVCVVCVVCLFALT